MDAPADKPVKKKSEGKVPKRPRRSGDFTSERASEVAKKREQAKRERPKGRTDFSQVVMNVYHDIDGDKKLENYAKRHPERFLERFFQPIAVKQVNSTEDDKGGVDKGAELATDLLQKWLKEKTQPSDGQPVNSVPANP